MHKYQGRPPYTLIFASHSRMSIGSSRMPWNGPPPRSMMHKTPRPILLTSLLPANATQATTLTDIQIMDLMQSCFASAVKTGTCNHCSKKPGHWKRECPEQKNKQEARAVRIAIKVAAHLKRCANKDGAPLLLQPRATLPSNMPRATPSARGGRRRMTRTPTRAATARTASDPDPDPAPDQAPDPASDPVLTRIFFLCPTHLLGLSTVVSLPFQDVRSIPFIWRFLHSYLAWLCIGAMVTIRCIFDTSTIMSFVSLVARFLLSCPA
jgi:hypothetical protein